ncbi:hypothetical protein M5K25_007086 [Dendrobium thyrsiflorum]|uniref:Uncharacterized protein n=1 Tax=Dendrobium thyrsiflorum TaxID=117978 RepID=A0ABD0VDC4_DENTH
MLLLCWDRLPKSHPPLAPNGPIQTIGSYGSPNSQDWTVGNQRWMHDRSQQSSSTWRNLLLMLIIYHSSQCSLLNLSPSFPSPPPPPPPPQRLLYSRTVKVNAKREEGYIQILQSPFFDVDLEIDHTIEGYVARILDTIVLAVEEQLGTVEWRLASRSGDLPRILNKGKLLPPFFYFRFLLISDTWWRRTRGALGGLHVAAAGQRPTKAWHPTGGTVAGDTVEGRQLPCVDVWVAPTLPWALQKLPSSTGPMRSWLPFTSYFLATTWQLLTPQIEETVKIKEPSTEEVGLNGDEPALLRLLNLNELKVEGNGRLTFGGA